MSPPFSALRYPSIELGTLSINISPTHHKNFDSYDSKDSSCQQFNLLSLINNRMGTLLMGNGGSGIGSKVWDRWVGSIQDPWYSPLRMGWPPEVIPYGVDYTMGIV